MNNFEVLIPILAILVGGTIIILPIAGLTARFAIKPIVEALAHARGLQPAEGSQAASVERRLAALEEQVLRLETEHERLEAAAEFHRKLGAGEGV